MYLTDRREAARVGNAARKVGGYAELLRLNEQYIEMKERGKQPKIVREDGVWVVREKGTS